jgi:hypothetical protein
LFVSRRYGQSLAEARQERKARQRQVADVRQHLYAGVTQRRDNRRLLIADVQIALI